MVYSASFIFAQERFGDSYFFIKKHALFIFLGFISLISAYSIKSELWQKFVPIFMIIAIFLSILTIIPNIGIKVGGARRWLNIFSIFRFQTSELVKIAVILFLSNYYTKHKDTKSFKTLVIVPISTIFPLLILVFIQPDFSTAVMLFSIVFLIMFAVGVKTWQLGAIIIFLIGIAIPFVINSTYRLRRLTSFLNPWDYSESSGFQIIQSYVAISSGKFWGLGFGNSKEKLFYLPEAHNDFIFAVLAEELGFIGVLVLFILFFGLIYTGFRISFRANNRFDSLFTFSIMVTILFQFIFNISVVLGLFPVTGVPLPFISYGGSSLVILMSMMGVILHVAKKTDSSKRSL